MRDDKARGREFSKLMAVFRDDMLQRSAKSIKVSNSVLEDQAQDVDYKFVTCGKEVKALPTESISI